MQEKARITFIHDNKEVGTINTPFIPRVGEQVSIGENFLKVVDVAYVYTLCIVTHRYNLDVTILLQ